MEVSYADAVCVNRRFHHGKTKTIGQNKNNEKEVEKNINGAT